jgi:hypothetical protein
MYERRRGINVCTSPGPLFTDRIYRITILSFVFVSLHGCETWSPQLREEQRLRLFENSVLRRIFGPKRK